MLSISYRISLLMIDFFFGKGAMICINEPSIIIQTMMKLYEWRLYNSGIETKGK
jgi:hypothetical protein